MVEHLSSEQKAVNLSLISGGFLFAQPGPIYLMNRVVSGTTPSVISFVVSFLHSLDRFI